jgi:hypothetical protein
MLDTIKRYPLQLWVLISNLGVVAWLQTHGQVMLQTGEDFINAHQGTMMSWIDYIKLHPIWLLVIGVIFLILLSLVKRTLKIIFTLLNLVLLAKLVGII